MEVLVSVFILLFGLMAVVMLLPVAGLRIQQTIQSDRSAACGQSALCDVKARRMLDPEKWLKYTPSAGFPPNANGFYPAAGVPAQILFAQSFAIDPLGWARMAGDADAAWFPYVLGGLPAIRMARVTLDINPASNDPLDPTTYRDMPPPLADRLFTWRDDLAFVAIDEERPELSMIESGGNNLAAQIDGRYSWLVTVTPQATAPDPGIGNNILIDNHRTYLVSVVVFHNRDFSPPDALANPDTPAERMVTAKVVGEGYGGGEVRLFLPSDTTDPATYLNVKKDDWLMLCGTNSAGKNVFHWYRVVSAGEDPQPVSGGGWERYVTLAGPDWSTNWHTGMVGEVDAALFTNILGVYTSTITLDDAGSVWNQ